MSPSRAASFAVLLWALLGCSTAGSTWMAEPLPSHTWQEGPGEMPRELARTEDARGARVKPRGTRVLSGSEPTSESSFSEGSEVGATVAGGRSLGTFRNTYYDFPSETEFEGPSIALKNARCETIEDVPRGFFESVCVQGSGTLKAGATVSFAKRDCECAEVCPRTNEKICFDKLDPRAFPWGRGATGKPITPLLSVAVDSQVVPLGTALYVPELDGLPRDLVRSSVHDGCFLAEDRGIRVKGKHIDVFTGHTSITSLWNHLVPSNRGVTVVLDSPRCARAKVGASLDSSRPR